jgi:hypothetical protein
MWADGLTPCVVLQTSPGNLQFQVWLRVSTTPLEPAVASSIGKQWALCYGGDLASTDGRPLGLLAGFITKNRSGATGGPRSLGQAAPNLMPAWGRRALLCSRPNAVRLAHRSGPWLRLRGADYQHRLGGSLHGDPHLCRWVAPAADSPTLPTADGSIADQWIAKELLRRGMSVPPPPHSARWQSGFSAPTLST